MLAESGSERSKPWNEDLAIRMPDRWIEPSEVMPSLPPYYADIFRGHIDWMQKPHKSLAQLPWRINLDFIYRPLEPSVRVEETQSPTTYFVYETIYSFFAGITTGEIPGRASIDPLRAEYLRRKIMVNFAELMLGITELANGAMSFGQVHNAKNHTYRLLKPQFVFRDKARYPIINSYTGKEYSLFNATFQPETARFILKYSELDSLRFSPAISAEENSSTAGSLCLDRSRPSTGERRLMIDLGVDEILWERCNDTITGARVNGGRSFLHEYLGKDIHHINLLTSQGEGPVHSAIGTVTREIMSELGLSCLLEQPAT